MALWMKPGVQCVYSGGTVAPDGYKPGRATPLNLGAVYTIREVLRDPRHPNIIGAYVLEVTNGFHPTLGLEFGYFASDFRPVSYSPKSQSEDASMFQKLLSPTHKEKV